MSDTQANQELLEQFKQHEAFCRVMLDAYCVIDGSGRVVKCNQLFSQVVGMTRKQIQRAETLDEILKLSIRGAPLKAEALLDIQQPTRIDEVTGASSFSSGLNLILGVYKYSVEEEAIGAFVLIRDVTAETKLQDKYRDKATESVTDHLTSLYNRSYMERYLESVVNMTTNLPPTAEQAQLSVVMLDIDFFKKINDEYGHQAGDYVLKVVSSTVKGHCRKSDVICRYGGEEFIAILPTTHIEGARQVAEKFRQAIEAMRIEFEDRHIPVTMSCGVAQFRPGSEAMTETIARADAALYHSKGQGRNCVSYHNGKEVTKSEL